MNSTNETLLFDRFLIMYNLCAFTCIILIFVFHCTHVRMSYVLNSYLLTYLHWKCLKLQFLIHQSC